MNGKILNKTGLLLIQSLYFGFIILPFLKFFKNFWFRGESNLLMKICGLFQILIFYEKIINKKKII